MKFNKNDIVTIKMLGGDEVIARLHDEYNPASQTRISVVKPLVVMMAQQGFGLVPFVLTAEEGPITLSVTNHILCISKTIKAVADEYIKQTTGLVV